MRTLVVHTGGIGDFLLALPAITCIAGPANLVLAGHRDRLSLAVAGGLACEAHSLEAIEFHTVFSEPSRTCARFLNGFERVVVWMRDPSDHILTTLQGCTSAEVSVFPGLPDADWTEHAGRYYARCLGVFAPQTLNLRVDAHGRKHGLVIHPGSGSVGKNWPLDRFVAVADTFGSRGIPVTWCIGPAEIDRQSIPDTFTPTLECASLTELAARLATATAYLGNDSGISHLAAALGIPAVVIFGKTDPKVWAPIGAKVQVVTGAPWPETDAVLEALSEEL